MKTSVIFMHLHAMADFEGLVIHIAIYSYIAIYIAI